MIMKNQYLLIVTKLLKMFTFDDLPYYFLYVSCTISCIIRSVFYG